MEESTNQANWVMAILGIVRLGVYLKLIDICLTRPCTETVKDEVIFLLLNIPKNRWKSLITKTYIPVVKQDIYRNRNQVKSSIETAIEWTHLYTVDINQVK